jgi:hypothetical protein
LILLNCSNLQVATSLPLLLRTPKMGRRFLCSSSCPRKRAHGALQHRP